MEDRMTFANRRIVKRGKGLYNCYHLAMGRAQGQMKDLFSSTFGDRRGAPNLSATTPQSGVSSPQGMEAILKMSDEELLCGARDPSEEPYAIVMKALDMHENLRWHMARCAEEAFRRGLIDQHELDRLCW